VIIDAGHRKWMNASLLVTTVATACYIPYHLRSLNGPSGGSWPGLTYGIVGSGMMLFAGLLSARRMVPIWRLGRAETWMRAHIWLGLVSVPMILFHAGFQIGGTLTAVLMLLFLLVIVSGVFGLALQQFLPRVMMNQVQMETIYEQIPHVLDQLREEADQLVTSACGPITSEGFSVSHPAGETPRPSARPRPAVPLEGSAPLKEFYVQEVKPFLGSNGRAGRMGTRVTATSIFAQVRAVLPPPLHETLADLEDICEERRQLAQQVRFHHWLHGWLFAHVPLSMALLVLSAAHAVMALRY
jgi:hypothetical protein